VRELCERAARAAVAVIRDRAPREVRHKGAIDLVTDVDLASEEVLRTLLAQQTPDIPVIGEEGSGPSAPLPDTCWIVDPLDGTTNFVHGYPAYSVSIALRLDGRIAAACVHDAVRDRACSAERGRGAFSAGVPLRVSSRATLDEALLATGFAYDRRERADFYLSYFRAFMVRTQGIRRAGSAALDLCWLAEGRVDGFWEFGLKPWDIAAGALLVEEAQGIVSDLDGAALDLRGARILASNGHLHREMLAVLAAVQAAGGDRFARTTGA
jgi:myo-inositol-1(or 4)-monophosphatase